MSLNNLYVPIYLNQRIVFDMLAIIEDGFSQLSTVQTCQSNSSKEGADISGEIGTSNIFAFLKANFKAAVKGEEQSNEQSTILQERVHTPTSLFSKLYTRLNNDNIIKFIDSKDKLDTIEPGDFIEFEGKLSKNPLVALLESFQMLGELAMLFENEKTGKDNKSNKNKMLENKKIITQIKALSDSLKNGNMFDLICKINNDKDLKAVLPVYVDYFYNKNMNEIIDGEYRILGKVTKVVNNSEDESINLLRNTSFSLFQESLLNQMFNTFNSASEYGLEISKIETSITAPAIQVIPFAIYA
ncbi:DUF6414 family protein [Clostridium sporogenes]